MQQKPRDVSAEIQPLIQAYNGDLFKVQEFVIKNFEKREIFNAGYQICLIQTNERLAKENALRDIFKNVLRGKILLPFDPREDPQFIKLIQKLAPASAHVEIPREIPITQVQGAERESPRTDEDFTTSEEQRLAAIRDFLDEGETGA